MTLKAFHDPLHQHAVINIMDDDPGDRSLSQLSNCLAVLICIAGLHFKQRKEWFGMSQQIRQTESFLAQRRVAPDYQPSHSWQG